MTDRIALEAPFWYWLVQLLSALIGQTLVTLLLLQWLAGSGQRFRYWWRRQPGRLRRYRAGAPEPTADDPRNLQVPAIYRRALHPTSRKGQPK